MKAYLLRIITTALLVAGVAGCAGANAANPAVDTTAQTATTNNFAAKKTMRAFRSEQELKSYLKELAEKMKRESRRAAGGGVAMLAEAPVTSMLAKSAVVAGAAEADSV